MLKKSFFSFLALTSLLIAAEEDPSFCGSSPRPIRETVRHIEANGIGYNQGYSTIEVFFSPSKLLKDVWIPFVDLRGHIFNDSKFAANAGLGVRCFEASRVWGGNVYYDYRNTSVQHYNQVSLGLETLGQIWDFRINGYLPVGDKESSLFDIECASFASHYLVVPSKQEFAMKGANAEVGFHVDKWQKAPLYFAAGPYYLKGQGKVVWGGELRAAVDLFDYVRLEGNTSYDNLFKWIGQGQLSVTIPLGKKRQVRQRKELSCEQSLVLSKRALQRVDRFEIIPVDTQDIKTAMVNPDSCLPYFFWFVDNTSCNTAGTFEEPFNTLAQAEEVSLPGEIIYVFSGDGTSKGMDQGITLQDNQKLLGSGAAHTFSTIFGCATIPAGCAYPLIDDANRVNAHQGCVQLANSCEVAGLHITSTKGGLGILGGDNFFKPNFVGVTNTNIHDNIITDITGLSAVNSSAVLLANCSGTLIVRNNTISNGAKFGIAVANEATNNTVNQSVIIEQNNLTAEVVSTGILIQQSVSGSVDFCINNNELAVSSGSASTAAILVLQDDGTICGSIESNKIYSVGSAVSLDHSTIIALSGGVANIEFTDNRASGTAGFLTQVFTPSIFCLGLKGNVDTGGFGLYNISPYGIFNVESSNGLLSGVQSLNGGPVLTSVTGTINFVPIGSCACNTPCTLDDNQGCCDLTLNGESMDPLSSAAVLPSGIDLVEMSAQDH